MARKKMMKPGHDSAAVKILSVAVIAMIACALAGSLLWLNHEQNKRAGIDPETLCPKAGPVAVTAVLVDRTDALNEIQAEALARLMKTWADAVPEGGAFHVYEVGMGGRLLAPVVAVCNPGTGEEKSELIANIDMLKKRYREKYEAPIDAMIEAMRADSRADTSPIMEGIQAIAVRDFGPDQPKALKKKTLFIVSDLLQNGSGFSAYAGVPKLDEFMKSAAGQALKVSLDGVETWIYVLNRNSPKQTGVLLQFWMDWLTLQGADIQEKRNIPG